MSQETKEETRTEPKVILPENPQGAQNSERFKAAKDVDHSRTVPRGGSAKDINDIISGATDDSQSSEDENTKETQELRDKIRGEAKNVRPLKVEGEGDERDAKPDENGENTDGPDEGQEGEGDDEQSAVDSFEEAIAKEYGSGSVPRKKNRSKPADHMRAEIKRKSEELEKLREENDKLKASGITPNQRMDDHPKLVEIFNSYKEDLAEAKSMYPEIALKMDEMVEEANKVRRDGGTPEDVLDSVIDAIVDSKPSLMSESRTIARTIIPLLKHIDNYDAQKTELSKSHDTARYEIAKHNYNGDKVRWKQIKGSLVKVDKEEIPKGSALLKHFIARHQDNPTFEEHARVIDGEDGVLEKLFSPLEPLKASDFPHMSTMDFNKMVEKRDMDRGKNLELHVPELVRIALYAQAMFPHLIRSMHSSEEAVKESSGYDFGKSTSKPVTSGEPKHKPTARDYNNSIMGS